MNYTGLKADKILQEMQEKALSSYENKDGKK